jgi:replication factor A1
MGIIVLTLEETIKLILDNQSEFDRSDILKMIQEKRDELGPEIVNDESAAMIIARELGIDLQQMSGKGRLQIKDITEETRNVSIIVKVVSTGDVRTFSRQDGTEGKVANLTVADENDRIRLVLWDEKTQAITDGALEPGTVIQIRGGYVKKGLGDSLEINLGRTGYINPLDDYEMEDLDVDLSDAEIVKIEDLKDRMFNITVKVKVGNVYPISTFTRKSDGSEGKVLSIQAADDTGSTRVVFWDDKAELMKDVKVGEIISVSSANSREGRYGNIEVHAGRTTVIQRELDEKIDAVPIETSFSAEPVGMKTISELTMDMKDVDIEGKVVSVYEVRTFDRDGKEGRVQNVVIADETGRIRVTFWNDDVDKIKDLKEEDILRIIHGYCKEGYQGGVEYQVGFKAEIEINPKKSKLKSLDISDFAENPPRQYGRVMIGDITDETEGQSVEVSGIVVKVPQFSPVYLSCPNPNCMKKVQEEDGKYLCPNCGEVKKAEPRMLYKVTLDDGSGTIRVTLFGQAGEKLLQMTAAEAQKMIEKSEDPKAPFDENSDKMLGRYVVVNGRVTKFRDSLDISAAGLDFVDPEKEILRMKGQIEELTN